MAEILECPVSTAKSRLYTALELLKATLEPTMLRGRFMSCQSYDWKAYALGELDRPAREQAETHHSTCASCREELATLRLTLDTLCRLCARKKSRGGSRLCPTKFSSRAGGSGAFCVLSPNFAAACVIAAAILVHAFARASGPDPAQTQALIQAQVNAAVSQAVAQKTAAALPICVRCLSGRNKSSFEIKELCVNEK